MSPPAPGRPDGPRARPVVRSGAVKIWVDGQPQKLRQKVTVLGRDPRADVAVLHAEVSRKHAVVVSLGEDRYLLMDFKSANGTRLNGRKIEAAELRDGDQIDLAGAILTVEQEHRRRGSMAATGQYKTLLEMEAARADGEGVEAASLGAVFWNERLDEVSPVLPLLSGLRAVQDLDQAAEETLRACLQGIGADRGLLLLLDDEGRSLRMKQEIGYPEGTGVRRNLHQVLLDEAVDNDRIVSTGPKYLDEVFRDLGGRRGGRPDVAAAMAAPLNLCGTSIGAVYLDRRLEGQPFRGRERGLLRFLTQLCTSHLGTLLLQKQVTDRLGEMRVLDVFLNRTGIGNCEICGEGLARSDLPLVRCIECATTYHEDCWGFLGKCAIFACEGHLATTFRPPRD